MEDIAVYCNSQWEVNVVAAIMDTHIRGKPLDLTYTPYGGEYIVGADTYPYVYIDYGHASSWSEQDIEGKTIMPFGDFVRDYGEVVHDISDYEFQRIAV